MKSLLFLIVVLVLVSSAHAQSPVQLSNTQSPHETPIAINPTNTSNIIAAAITYPNNPSQLPRHIGCWRTINFGNGWSGNNSVTQDDSSDNPVLAFDPDGNAYLAHLSLSRGICIQKSIDSGATWGNQSKVNGSSHPSVDKPWLAISPVRNGDSTFNIYVSCTTLDGGSVVLMRSTSNLANFVETKLFSTIYHHTYQGSSLAIGPNGAVVLAWVELESDDAGFTWAKAMHVTRSTDGGITFQTEKVVNVNQIGLWSSANGYFYLKNPVNRINSFPSLAVDQLNGNAYVVWPSAYSSLRRDADLMMISGRPSADTMMWDTGVNDISYNDTLNQWSPSLTITPDGILSIMCYTSHSDPTTNVYVELMYSTNGGTTFTNLGYINSGFPVTNFLGDYQGITSSLGKAYSHWCESAPDGSRSNWFEKDSRIGELTRSGFQKLMISQVDASSQPFGKIGFWNQGAFTSAVTGTRLQFRSNGDTVLKATQSYKPATVQKHHDWYSIVNVANHQDLPITSGTSAFTSEFVPTDTTVTIQAQLIDGGPLGGTVQIMDPWLVDTTDSRFLQAPYGYRSLGMSAPFKMGSSPLRLSANSKYKGTFLNQPLSGATYYSIGAPNPDSIAGFPGYFLNWRTVQGVAQFADSTSIQTPVRFNQSNTTVTARFKAHLGTGSTSISNAINQRRVVSTTSGSWFLLYESMGDVWLTYSGDNGQTWQVEERLNIIQGQASNPSISNVYGPSSRVIMSWLEQNGSTTEMHLQTMYICSQPYYGWNQSDGTRSSNNHRTMTSIYGYPSPRTDARPVLLLEADGNNIMLTFSYERNGNGMVAGRISITADLNTATPIQEGGNRYRTLSTSTGDLYPVIISYPSVYGYPARKCVYYLGAGYAPGKRLVEYDYGTMQSALIPGGAGDYTYYSLQGSPNPSGGSFALVAEGTNTANYFVNYYVKETYLGTSPPHLSTSYLDMRQPTVMVQNSSVFGAATTEVDMRSSSSETWYKGGSVALTSYTSNKTGVFARDIVLSTDRASVIFRDTTNPPYHVAFYSGVGTFQKVDNSTPINIRAVRFWAQDGSTEHPTVLDFSGDNVSFIDSLESGRSICVAKVSSPSAAGQIVQQVDSLAVPLQVDLVRGGTVIRSLPSSSWSGLSVSTIPQFLSGDILRFSLAPGATEVRGYTEVSLRNSVDQKEVIIGAGENPIPHSFAMSAYPNPFNPTTTIQYDLSTGGRVSLVVYDVLGRQVIELTHADQDAGSYSVVWNATNQSGAHISSGVYFIRLSVTGSLGSAQFTKTDKIILMR